MQDNWLHQLAKLHDPAVQGGHTNLSVEYMIEYGQWNSEVKSKLIGLQTKMLTLATPIKDARNKILSHNDLTVLLADTELGGFSPGEDEKYFETLRKFASLLSEEVMGESFEYENLVRNDIEIFMHDFLLGRDAIFGQKN